MILKQKRLSSVSKMRHTMSLLICIILVSTVFTSIPKNEQLPIGGVDSQSIVYAGWNHGSQEGSILSNSTATVGGGDGASNEEFVCIIHEASFEVYCWGKNDQGQLGLGDTIDRSRPSTVGIHQPLQLPMTATSIDAGGSHTCAIGLSEDIYCWGANDFGQLGSAPSTTQQNYASPDIDWSAYTPLAISSGGTSSCAILADNQLSKSLWCWGYLSAQGNGLQPPDYQGTCPYQQVMDISDPSVTVCVSALPNQWDTDGDGWAIHSGAYGYLQAYGQGDCNDNDQNTNPGQNEIPGDGQDNDCDGITDETLQQIPLPNQPIQVSVGKEHVCVMTDTQELYCWGDDSNGQSTGLYGQYTNQPQLLDFTSLAINGQTPTPLRVASGSAHTCAILSDQSVACWGKWLGLSSSSVGVTLPVTMARVSATNPNWTPTGSSPTAWMEATSQTHALVPTSISAGAEHTCIIAQNIVLEPFTSPQAPAPSLRPYALCWGNGESGQLGLGQDFNSYSEYKYVETRSFEQEGSGMTDFSTLVVAGGDTTCTVKTVSDPTIRCFGSNDAGTYGHDRVWPDSYYTTEISAQSRIGISQAGTWDGISVKNNQETVIDIDTSSSDTGCFITENLDSSLPNKMYCWGVFIHAPLGSPSSANAMNLDYQYNVNTLDSERLPQEVIMPTGLSPILVKVSANWACAIMNDGSIWCWGEEMIVPDLDQTQEGRESCSHHSLDDGHPMSISYYCKGQFRSGDGAPGDLHQIPMNGAISLNLGLGMGCAATASGEVKCWGLDWAYGTKQASHLNQRWLGGYPSTAPSSGLNGNSNFATQTWVLLDGQTPDTSTNSFQPSNTQYDIFSSNRGGGFFDLMGMNMCIKVVSGKVVCYGSQVGVLNTPFDENKVNTWLDTDDPAYLDGVAIFGHEITSVAKNVWSICVTLSSGDIYCAGENKYGQLGDGTIVQDSLGHDWTQVITNGQDFNRIVMSDARSICAWNNDLGTTQNPTSENVLCWGSAFAELPIGQSCGTDSPLWIPCFASSRDIIATPTEAYLLKGVGMVSEIQLNAMGGCVIADGNLGCWGHYDGGQGCHSDEQAAAELIIPGCTTELRVELPGTDNSAPTISSVVITPDMGVTNTTVLLCSVIGPADLDADPLLPYEYEWVLTTPQGDVYTYNATSSSTSNPLDLPATAYSSVFGYLASPGDVIECFVTITDIYGASSTMQSNAVTVMGAKYYDADGDGFGWLSSVPIYVPGCSVDSDCGVDAYGQPAFYGNVPATGYCIDYVCDLGPNYVDNNLDCNDQAAWINPAQTEINNNGVDDDCDGQIDSPPGPPNPSISAATLIDEYKIPAVILLSFIGIIFIGKLLKKN